MRADCMGPTPSWRLADTTTVRRYAAIQLTRGLLKYTVFPFVPLAWDVPAVASNL